MQASEQNIHVRESQGIWKFVEVSDHTFFMNSDDHTLYA